VTTRNTGTASRWVLFSVAAVGIAIAVVVASIGKMSVSSTFGLLAWTIGGAAVSTLVAAVLLRQLRRRSAAVQVTIASLAPVVAIAAGVVGGSWAMFISSHDLRALIVILVGAGTVGVMTALLFGNRISRASAGLGELARRIAENDENDEKGKAPPSNVRKDRIVAQAEGPGELARLASELDAALERLAQSRAEAAAVEQSRRELVAWVSHDLRTPLAGIRAMVEALEDGVVDDRETVDRYHRTIGVEVDRLASLVADLFELSRIQAGALQLKLMAVPLDEVLGDIVAGATLLARAKGVRLESSLEGAPTVRVAVAEIRRAVQNLLDNAIRHTPPGSTVVVEAAAAPGAGEASVSVSDGCGGIPERDLSRVFDLAFRGDDARTPGDGRAGLGLAVTQGLVEAQRGKVSVANIPGGCRFTIRLPLASPDRSPSGTPLEQVL
jgi:signal transduction histidine kinase